MYEHLHRQGPDNRRHHAGVILLVTLVILVILSTLGYTLCAQVAARRHRNQYMIDYCLARHACASGVKYALASMLGSLQYELVSRPNEPDFSDVFALSETEYQKLLEWAAAKQAADSNLAPEKAAMTWLTQQDTGRNAKKGSSRRTAGSRDVNDVNDVNDLGWDRAAMKPPEIRGPYGPRWPLVVEPMEFEVGSAKVKIEVEDENAKYPLGWVMIDDEKLQPEASAGWATFCEWMGYTPMEIASLREGLAKIGRTKPFKMEFKVAAENVPPPPAIRSRITRPTPGRSNTVARRTVTRKPVTVEEQLDRQNKEYAKLLHSSLVNRELLSRQSIASDTRKESALKYLGLWGTRQVNVNSAPRQVLEAALAFGSVADAPKIAEGIIQQRRLRPVSDVNELKQVIPQYSSAIDDCRTFITARSTVFTIHVTAISGVATVSAVLAVTREGDKMQPIAVISD